MTPPTTRELLTLAAKAAGIDAEVHSELGYGPEGLWLNGARSPDNSKYWNPLVDDGDALRLAVKLNLLADGRTYAYEPDEWRLDPYAATRLAIVRAAASLGKEKT